MDKAIREVLTEALILQVFRERVHHQTLKGTWAKDLIRLLEARDEVFLPPKISTRFFRAAMVRLMATGLVLQGIRGWYWLEEEV